MKKHSLTRTVLKSRLKAIEKRSKPPRKPPFKDPTFGDRNPRWLKKKYPEVADKIIDYKIDSETMRCSGCNSYAAFREINEVTGKKRFSRKCEWCDRHNEGIVISCIIFD